MSEFLRDILNLKIIDSYPELDVNSKEVKEKIEYLANRFRPPMGCEEFIDEMDMELRLMIDRKKEDYEYYGKDD